MSFIKTNHTKAYIGSVQVKAIHGAHAEVKEIPAPGGIDATVYPGTPPVE